MSVRKITPVSPALQKADLAASKSLDEVLPNTGLERKTEYLDDLVVPSDTINTDPAKLQYVAPTIDTTKTVIKPIVEPKLTIDPSLVNSTETTGEESIEETVDILDRAEDYLNEAGEIETEINQKRPGLLLLGLGVLAVAYLFRK